jgi:hypothetical protein
LFFKGRECRRWHPTDSFIHSSLWPVSSLLCHILFSSLLEPWLGGRRQRAKDQGNTDVGQHSEHHSGLHLHMPTLAAWPRRSHCLTRPWFPLSLTRPWFPLHKKERLMISKTLFPFWSPLSVVLRKFSWSQHSFLPGTQVRMVRHRPSPIYLLWDKHDCVGTLPWRGLLWAWREIALCSGREQEEDVAHI